MHPDQDYPLHDDDNDGMPDFIDVVVNGQFNAQGLVPVDVPPQNVGDYLTGIGIECPQIAAVMSNVEAGFGEGFVGNFLDLNNDGAIFLGELVSNIGRGLAATKAAYDERYDASYVASGELGELSLSELTTWRNDTLDLVAGLQAFGAASVALKPDFYKGQLGGWIKEMAGSFGAHADALQVVISAEAFIISNAVSSALAAGLLPPPDGLAGLTVNATVAGALIALGVADKQAFQDVITTLENSHGDPVDTSNGEFQYEVTDLSYIGRGIDLSFTRYYNSRSIHYGILGHNWSMPLLETSIVFLGDPNVCYVNWGDGTTSLFHFSSTTGQYIGDAGVYSKISIGTYPADADFSKYPVTPVLRMRDGQEYHFCPPQWVAGIGFAGAGLLRKYADPDGNAITIVRDDAGKAKEIYDTLGRRLVLTYDEGRGLLTEILDWGGKYVRFHYDLQRHLLLSIEKPHSLYLSNTAVGSESLSSAPYTEEYTYHEHPETWAINKDKYLNHNLHSIARNGSLLPQVVVEYYTTNDYSFDKVAQYTTEWGTTVYTYESWGDGTANGSDPYQPSQVRHATIVLHPDGERLRFLHGNGLLHRKEVWNGRFDLAGNMTEGPYVNSSEGVAHSVWMEMYSYDAEPRLTEKLITTDALYPVGRKLIYAYDTLNQDRFQQGNVIEIRQVPSSTLHGEQDLVTTIEYDPITAAPTRIVGPDGTEWRTTYSHHEWDFAVVQQWNRVKRWGLLDNVGSAVQASFGAGDLNGNGLRPDSHHAIRQLSPPVDVSDPSGPGNTIQTPLSTIVAYNQFGQPTLIVDSAQRSTSISYDAGYPHIIASDPNGVNAKTAYRFDQWGRVYRVLAEDSASTDALIDSNGLIMEVRRGPSTIAEAYFASNTGPIATPYNQGLPTPVEADVSTVYYDREHRVVAHGLLYRDDSGLPYGSGGARAPATDVIEYSARGLVLAREDRRYDNVGNHLGTARWEYDYDGLERLIKERNPRGGIHQYIRLANGRVTSIERIDSTGAPEGTTTFEFTPYGQMERERDPRGRTTRYEYDGFGRLVASIEPNGVRVEHILNHEGRPLTTRVLRGPSEVGRTDNVYDVLGRLRSRTVQNFVSLPDGSCVEVGQPGMPAEVSPYNAAEFKQEFGYGSGVGDLLWIASVVSGGPPGIRLQRFSYDSMGRQYSQFYGSTDEVGFVEAFDLSGKVVNRTEVRDGSGTTGAVNPSHAVWTFQYGVRQNLWKKTMPDGGVWQYNYDAGGNIKKITDPLGRVERRKYTSHGDIYLQTQVGDGNVPDRSFQWVYNDDGTLKEWRDAKGNVTSYTYDEFYRLKQRQYSDLSADTWWYSNADEVERVARGDGSSFWYDYDSVTGELMTFDVSSSSGDISRSFEYDPFGRIVTVADQRVGSPIVTTEVWRDTSGRHVSERTLIAGSSPTLVRAAFDSSGLLTRLVYSSGNEVTRLFDSVGRLAASTHSAGGVAGSYSNHYGLGAVRTVALPGGAVRRMEYDSTGRTTRATDYSATAAVISGNAYEYDLVGNMVGRTEIASDEDDEFEFDVFDRLVQWRQNVTATSQGRLVTWGWDASNNLESYVDDAGLTMTFSTNNLDQVTAQLPIYSSVDHDGSGREVYRSGAETATYSYDGADRLIATNTSSGSSAHVYDGFDRLLEMSEGAETKRFTCLGSAIIEVDSSVDGVTEYVPGFDPDGPEAYWDGGQLWLIQKDIVGSPVAVHNGTQLAEGFTYDPFGLARDANGAPLLSPANGLDLLYLSKPISSTSGLVHMGPRVYDPVGGRFLSRDPLALEGGNNLYSYGNANPFRYVDPSGLRPEEAQGIGAGNFGEAGYDAGEGYSDLFSSRLGFVLGSKTGVGLVEYIMSTQGANLESAWSQIAGRFPFLAERSDEPWNFANLSAKEQLGVLAYIDYASDWSLDGLRDAQKEAISEFRSWIYDGMSRLSRDIALDILDQATSVVETLTREGLKEAGFDDRSAGTISFVVGVVDPIGSGKAVAKKGLALTGEALVRGKRLAAALKGRLGEAARGVGSLDDLSRAAGVLDRNGLTKAGRALQKHSARPGSAFSTSATRAGDLNAAGQSVVDDILTAPGSVQRGNRLGGVDVLGTDGRGIRFNPDGSFRGFLEPPR